MVGISIPFTANKYAGIHTAEVIKEAELGIITILGGPHPSVAVEATLENEAVDYVVINEGEYSCPELLGKLEIGQQDQLAGVKGIAFKKDGRPVVNESGGYIADLDALPFPARHLLPLELYDLAAGQGFQSRQPYNIEAASNAVRAIRPTSMITSRGCPFKCTFCSINLTMGYNFRKRSPANVVAEIEDIYLNLNLNHVDFEDDNLTFDKARMREICDLIVERGLQITWATPNAIRADIIDADLVMRMKKSGCVRVAVAPESGDQDVVKNVLEKSINLDKVTESVRLFSAAGIAVDASFVVGSVGKNRRSETKMEIIRTLLYAWKLKSVGLGKAGFNIGHPPAPARNSTFTRKKMAIWSMPST